MIAYAEGSGRSGPTDSRSAELVIEFKWATVDDPFRDVYDRQNPDGTTSKSFIHDTLKAYDTLGQITGYATAQLGAQYRTHIYSVLIVKDEARILRWDRSGTIVTAPFKYNDTPHLIDFLTRFSSASPQQRGVDSSVSRPSPDVASEARAALKLNDSASLYNLEVTDSTGTRSFVVEAPSATAYTPPGRATRGSKAYDITRKAVVYLKDTWRVALDGFIPEGDTYQRLMDNNVPNIPKCLIAGDVGDDSFHSTRNHLYQDEEWACPTTTRLIPHRHYRLVLDVIGRSLTEFRSTLEMIRAVRDALKGK